MTRLARAVPESARRARPPREEGFSLIELTISMVVLAIILVLTFTLIVGIQQQQQNQAATVNGARNAQAAEQEVVQFLQGAATPNPGVNVPTGTQETATKLILPAYLGNAPSQVTGGGQDAPGVTTTLTATVNSCTTQCPKGVDELTVSMQGGTYQSPGTTITNNAYYLLAPTTPLFTYEMYPGGGVSTPVAMQMPVTNAACLQRIVAVKINASFLAGPINSRTLQGGAVVATTLQETVYVKNACTAYNATCVGLLALPVGGC